MNLFLDASVTLGACGRRAGASHAIFDFAARNGWTMMASPYLLSEVTAATAWAQVLLTLDRGDFGALMSGGFYGLEMLTPGNFLERERAAGRLL